jgi:hypothetical protein
MTDWDFSQWYVAAVILFLCYSASSSKINADPPWIVTLAKSINISIYAGVVAALISGGFF